MQGIYDAVMSALQSIIDLLNPWTNILRGLRVLKFLMPSPVNMAPIVDNMRIATDMMAPWFLAGDYFVHMPILVIAIGFCLTIETALVILRVWRTVRSLFI